MCRRSVQKCCAERDGVERKGDRDLEPRVGGCEEEVEDCA